MIDFTCTKPRRSGLNKSDANGLRSLHGASLANKHFSKEEDIYAQPVDSSDDDVDVLAEEATDENDNGERGRTGSEAKATMTSPLPNQAISAKQDNDNDDHSQQGSQKRGSTSMEDDFDSWACGGSQQVRKKLRMSYGASQKKKLPPNIHLAREAPGKAKKASGQPLESLKKQVPDPNKFQSPAPLPPSKRPAFKKPDPPPPRLPRSFSKATSVFKDYGSVTRRTRSSQSAGNPLESKDGNRSPPLSAADLGDTVDISATLLGLENPKNITFTASGMDEGFRDRAEILRNASNPDGGRLLYSSSDLCTSSSGSKSPLASSFDRASVSSGLSTPPDSPTKSRCPLCHVLVEKLFLEGVNGGKRMTVRQQAEFCKLHKIKSAHDEWRERRYPEINWSKFDERLTSFHPRIEDLLQGSRLSFYRNALEDIVRKGKTRTLKQAMLQGEAMEGMQPGYYGSKGAKRMADNIINRFSSKLRRLQGSDKLISTSGVSGYVQAVLAPELAVMLVMDDMKIDEDGARQTIKESVDIGNLLNEEEDDMVYQVPEKTDDDAKVDLIVVD